MDNTEQLQLPVSMDLETESSLSLSDVKKYATESFPTEFLALPPVNKSTFKPQNMVTDDWKDPDRPVRPLKSIAHVGYYDNKRTNSLPTVYAFVHGEKSNQVGYMYQPRGCFGPIRLHGSDLCRIEFGEPICDLAGSSQSSITILNRARAAILYYFLAEGHLEKLSLYSHFWADLKGACASIVKSRKHPRDLVESVLAMDDQTHEPTELESPVSSPDASTSFQKRKRENNEQENLRRSARLKHSRHAYKPLCAIPYAPEPNLEAQIPQPKEEVSELVTPQQSPVTQGIVQSLEPLAGEKIIERLENTLQTTRSENAQLKEQIENLTISRSQLQEPQEPQKLQAASHPEQAQMQRRISNMAARIQELQKRHNFGENAYMGLDQKFKETQARLVATKSKLAAAEGTIEKLQREVANAKSTAMEMEKKLNDANERKESIKASLVNDATIMAKTAATMLEHANGLTEQLAASESYKAN